MGFFQNAQQSQARGVYAEMQASLAPKDGLVHVVMVNSFSKLGNQNFGCDTKYTTEINSIITAMQRNGYEIVDIKFNSITGQGMTGNRTGFNTVILYK